MIKLKDAKCPNCGATIQVNDKLKNTICQYCGSQVVIEEAIEKYKLEISGKVEVDGIKGRKTRINQAKKHFKIEEYDDAKKILKELVSEDSLDYDAYVELIKTNLMLLEKRNFNPFSTVKPKKEDWNLYDEIINDYNRTIKISDKEDPENSLLKDLGEYKDKINHYLEVEKNFQERKEEQKKYIDKLNSIMEELKDENQKKEEYWIINRYFKICDYDTSYGCSDAYYKDDYTFNKFAYFTREGFLGVNYTKTSNNDKKNSESINLYNLGADPIVSNEMIEDKINHIVEDSKNYVNKINKKIKSENSKMKFDRIFEIILGIFGICLLIMGIVIFIKGVSSSSISQKNKIWNIIKSVLLVIVGLVFGSLITEIAKPIEYKQLIDTNKF